MSSKSWEFSENGLKRCFCISGVQYFRSKTPKTFMYGTTDPHLKIYFSRNILLLLRRKDMRQNIYSKICKLWACRFGIFQCFVPYNCMCLLSTSLLKKSLGNYVLVDVQFRHLADALNPERLTLSKSKKTWQYINTY